MHIKPELYNYTAASHDLLFTLPSMTVPVPKAYIVGEGSRLFLAAQEPSAPYMDWRNCMSQVIFMEVCIRCISLGFNVTSQTLLDFASRTAKIKNISRLSFQYILWVKVKGRVSDCTDWLKSRSVVPSALTVHVKVLLDPQCWVFSVIKKHWDQHNTLSCF